MDHTEVSPLKRSLQIASSVLFCFTIAGLVFGFAALKPILEDSGVYSQLCKDGVKRCKEQDTRLNLLFIVASSVNNIAALPMGTYLDIVGPRIASITGGLIFGAGCATFALDIVRPYLDTYLIGYALMALGAPAMFLAQFHLSNAFPSRSGLILGGITGAFDASSLPLCFFKVAFFALGGKPTIKQFFLFYTAIPALLIIQQIAFGPPTIYTRPTPGVSPTNGAYPEPGTSPGESPNFVDPFHSGTQTPSRPGPGAADSLAPPSVSRASYAGGGPSYSPSHAGAQGHVFDSTFSRISRHSLSRPIESRNRRMSSTFSRISYGITDDADEDEMRAKLGRKKAEASTGAGAGDGEGKGDGIVGAMFGKGVAAQIGSSWFWAMEFMIIVHMTRINWYLTTVGNQLVYYTGEAELADTLETAFIFLLPLGGLLSIPAIGYLLDSRPTLDVILVMAVLAFFFGLLTMFTTTVPQLIGIGMLVVFRPLFYTAISDYAAKVFGFETFGTVYGLAMAMSGAFGLILTPLDLLTKNQLAGDFTPVNTSLLVLGVIAACTIAYRVWSYTRPGAIRLRGEEGESEGVRRDVIHEEDEED